MTHPLDPVESALIDAVNAMDDAMAVVRGSAAEARCTGVFMMIDAALRALQQQREHDVEALERS